MSEKKSKFAAILRNRTVEPSTATEESEDTTKTPLMASAPSGAGDLPPPKRPRGRPKANGKRLNPDYTQVTAYIPADLHTETKINLIRSGKREFSILIEELLTTWNKKHGSPEQTA